MPFFIAALWGGLATVLASMVGRILLALGLSYVTYKGLTHGTDMIVDQMKGSYSGLTGDIGALISWLWVDKALSMIVSAFAAAFAIRTSTGAITKLVLKK